MENLIIDDKEFRIRKMNAIELMALRTQLSFSNFEEAINTYSTLMENLEYHFKDKWLPVKEKGRNIFYPNGIEEDINAISQMLEYVLDYFKSVFPKSSKSNEEQE